MSFLLVIEALTLLAAAWYIWRRSRTVAPRRGRAFAYFVLALTLYLGVNVAANAAFTPRDRSAAAAAITLFAVQVVRSLLLAWAMRSWLEVVRPRLVRSWRGVLILICLGFIVLLPPSTVAFGILLVLPLARLKWTSDIRGWGRAALVVAFGVLTFALAASFDVTLLDTGSASVVATLGAGGSSTVVVGDLPQPAAALIALSGPWEHATRAMLVLLRISIMVAFLQLLVFPIRLRGLSLKRRFAVTLAMYRFIPGTLALVFMVLIAYLAIGLHRASLVTTAFDATLDGAMPAARSTDTSRPLGAAPMDTADRSYAVVRSLEWSEAPGDTGGEAGWVSRPLASSPGTPEAILLANVFDAVPDAEATGLVEIGGALYLRAAVIRRDGEHGTGAEVFVAVDSTYLARVGAKIRSDVRVDVSPGVFVGETGVRITDDEVDGWIDSTFTVAAPFVQQARGSGLLDRRIYLARTFLPMGNWLHPLGEEIGAAQLKLHTTPRVLWESLTGNAFMLTSQLFALFILGGIALLFLIVELSAVRTGRSIIKGIVSDVRDLTDAAARFGQGDLGHRVALSGKDEMGQLAATFNNMAANIEQHQEVLLEKERLEADLAVAREIQQRMLPQAPPSVPGLDLAGVSIPSREVGGDLFYFLPVANGRLGVTIGDVSGKSVPAALLMSNVLAALRSEARIVDREDEILGHLNRLIVDQIEPGRFVTFFYCVIDPRQRTLRYACAGHNPPLLMRASGEARWLHEAGVPLGVVAESTYTSFEVALESGDVLVLYSDGVTEAQRPAGPAGDGDDADAGMTEPEQEFFEERRLEAVVRDARGKTAAGVIGDVVEAVRAFSQGAELADDLTLVVAKISAPGPES